MTVELGEICARLSADEALGREELAAIIEGALGEQKGAYLGLLMELTEEDEGLLKRWWRAKGQPGLEGLDALELALAAALTSGRVEDAIDAMFEGEGATAMAEALMRRQQAWSHDRLDAMLWDAPRGEDHRALRAAVGLLLASGDEEAVLERLESAWSEEEDAQELSEEEILAIFEAAAPLLPMCEQLGQALLDIIEELEEAQDAEEKALARGLQALLFSAAPSELARRILSGQVELEELLGDSSANARWMALLALPSWLDVLAHMERAGVATTSSRYQLAALLCFVASDSFAKGAEEDGPESEELLEVLTTPEMEIKALNQWANQRAVEMGFDVAVGVSAEGQEHLLLEIAAHELLLARGAGSPGIVGLPLSGDQLEALDEEEARRQLLPRELPEDLEDEEYVALLRTMCDLRRWVLAQPERFGEFGREVSQVWSGARDPVLRLVAERLGQEGDSVEQLEQWATGEGAWALLALRELAQRGVSALGALARLWAQASWPGMMLVEDAFYEASHKGS